jgi:hypothetical protein
LNNNIGAGENMKMTDTLYREAKISYHNGDYDICEKKLMELCKYESEKPYATYNLSILYSHLNRTNWKDLYYQAMKLNPNLFDNISNSQKILRPCKEVERKLKIFREKIIPEEIVKVDNDTKDELVELILNEIEDQ